MIDLQMSCSGQHESDEVFANKYGSRALSLMQLTRIGRDIGFCVPEFGMIPTDFSKMINRECEVVDDSPKSQKNYLTERGSICKKVLWEHSNTLVEYAHRFSDDRRPIIRGTSSVEGYNDLSFAGVCKSTIPSKGNLCEYGVIKELIKSFATVATGCFSEFANYYFAHHSIPGSGRNVGIILMKVVDNPILHATAYVYYNEIAINCYSTKFGYFEMRVDFNGVPVGGFEKNALQFLREFGEVNHILKELYAKFYKNFTPIDVEFLMDKKSNTQRMQIVQIRPISPPHLSNYNNSNEIMLPNKIGDYFVINPSHLMHSVGRTSGTVIKLRHSSDKVDVRQYLKEFSSPIFVVGHDAGRGSLQLLNSLPDNLERQLTVVVTHPDSRMYDHMQYVMYEDRRVGMLLHCSEDIDKWMRNKDEVSICSNGRSVYINKN